MADKIGRNDPCPCGSGKKNKKCHNIDRLPDMPKHRRQVSVSAFEKFAEEHDSHGLLNAITALQLLPQNHGKNVRIEEIIALAIQHLGPGRPIQTDGFQKLLKSEFPNNHMEDPAENLFTENASFYYGNHVVFPGIASHPGEIFRVLTHIIFNTPLELPEVFRARVYQGITLLLNFADHIAELGGITGNLEKKDSDGYISVQSDPPDYSLTIEAFKDLCALLGIDPRAINDFILTTDRQDLSNGDPTFAPILYYPIIAYQNSFYYLLVSNQLNTLNEYILRMAAEYGCQEVLMMGYRKELWNQVLFACNEMGWRLTDIDIPPYPGDNAPMEAIFHFDNNRLAYVVLDTPLLIPDIFENPGTEHRPKGLSKHMKSVLDELKSREDLRDCQFLVMQLFDSCGRMHFGGIDSPKDREYKLAFPVHDFLLLYKGEDWDQHSLWKFAKAFARFIERSRTMSGIVELYSMYKRKSSSFYFSDDAAPDFLTIVPGEGSELIRAAKLKENFHAAPFSEGGEIHFYPVVSCGDFAPIYKPARPAGYFIEGLEGYRYPIWMVNRQVKNNKMASTVRLYTNALSFWLSKMMPSLADIINPVLDSPLTVELVLDNELFQDAPSGVLAPQVFEHYDMHLADEVLVLNVPLTSLRSFAGPVNEGERHMVRNFLEGLNLIGCEGLASDYITEMIDTYMPLGQAKMILVSDSQTDMMIDMRWLVKPFLMSDAELEMLMDELPLLISAEIEIPDKIASKEDKRRLFNTATMVLLSMLAAEVSQFDHVALLRVLMNLHESIVRKREYEKTIIPAQLLCFGGMEAKLDEIAENEHKQVRTSVALRNLIEYLAAQPAQGHLDPSLDDVDRLLAIMHEITNFGMMSDAVHFDMDDPEVGMLPSGRIGFTSELFSDKMVPFAQANIKADVDTKLESFSDRFEIYQEEEEEISEEIAAIVKSHDDAFLEDWGISWTNLIHMFHMAVKFCIDAEDSVIIIDEEVFIKRVVNEASIPEQQVRNGLEKLQLFPRESYLKAPEGYTNNEVFPWKYNREFSLTRRFMVSIPAHDGKTNLMWGFRGATAARHQLYYLLRGGRLNNGGTEIKKLIGSYTEERGTDFRNAVRDWLKEQPGFEVIDYEVAIRPGGPLNAQKVYGDVDVLAMHKPSRTVFSLECKNTTQAKNIHEMKTEMDRYLGRNGGRGMVDKHIDRDVWLQDNINQLQRLFKTDEDIVVKSLMISSQVIPTAYIKADSLPMPIIAFPDLRRMGISILLN
ncbi:YecA family protein [Flavobacterium sp. MK4S-17]|uniref:YecA family protein n=1 Tax=Flavobacterium sp. MK4S-17 TaxID=2543737 RepID=UPI0013580C50|nr:SEC-C metal-binding domain-containing protein [Flavobacterium sp. MK4S-17]